MALIGSRMQKKKRLFFQASLLNGCTKVYIFTGRTLDGSFKSSSYLLIPSLTLGFFSTHPLSLLMSSLSPLLILLSLSLPAGRVAVAGVCVVKATRDDGSRGRREHNEGGEGQGVWRWLFPARIWRWQREEHDLSGGNDGC